MGIGSDGGGANICVGFRGISRLGISLDISKSATASGISKVVS